MIDPDDCPHEETVPVQVLGPPKVKCVTCRKVLLVNCTDHDWQDARNNISPDRIRPQRCARCGAYPG